MRNKKYLLFPLALLLTATMGLWPNFHPEQKVFDQYHWQVDMLIHGGYYFILTLVLLALKLPLKPIVLAIIIAVFSYAIEILQIFSLKRAVSWMDAGSNTIGILLATGLFLLLTRSHWTRNKVQRA